ncbi:MAG: hypothetical protein AAGD14_10925 [Planctomycetota bacterium]
MRYDVVAAVLGIVVGAATLAVGEGEDELRDELAELQRQAARLRAKTFVAEDVPDTDPIGQSLAFFPVEDLTGPREYFLAPTNEFLNEDDESPMFGGQSEEAPQEFGTIEELAELIRTSVQPESWEEATMMPQGHFLIAYHTPALHQQIQDFLDDQLRKRVHRGYQLDFEVLEVRARDVPQVDAGAPLTNAQRTALEATFESDGKRVFAIRGNGSFLGRMVVWHGKQVAVLADADVEVAQTAITADPLVQVVQAGGFVAAEAQLRPDNRIALDLELRLTELDRIGRHETEKCGVLDLPHTVDQKAQADLQVEPGKWYIAGESARGEGRMRLFLVRAQLIERGGAR